MHHRTRWLAPLAALVAALALLTLALAASDRPAVTAAASALPFRNVAPLLASDSGPATTLVTATPTAPANVCGAGHASLVNFADPAAAAIPRDPTAVTLGFLRTQARPTLPADATRAGPVETTIYSVDATLVSMASGSGHSILLLLADATTGVTIRAELPDQPCTAGATTADRGATFNARTALRLACGDLPASGTKALTGSATLTGAGFWGPTAVADAAPNGIELGPLLSFAFTSPSCDPTHPTPTPTPTPVPVLGDVFVGSPDSLQGPPGVPPGTAITGYIRTVPVVVGIVCTAQFVTPPPPGQSVGTVIDDPAIFPPKPTGPDGYARWTFTVPLNSPPGNGSFGAHCGPKGSDVKVYVSAP